MNWAIERARVLQSSDRPDAFGVVLFTERHANLRKVLHDRLCWDALDEISGNRWTVLATMAFAGRWETPTRPAGLPRHLLYSMEAVWKEPKENRDLLEEFQLDASDVFPSLLVFGEQTPDQPYRLTIGLDDSSTEQAFASLKGAIAAVTRALEDIQSSNFKNTEGVFAAIDLSVTSYKQFQWIKRAVPLAKLLSKLAKGIGFPGAP